MRRLRITEFQELVRRKRLALGMNQEELQRASGMSNGTFHRKIGRPEGMTIAEFHNLDRILHFTDKEKLDFLAGYMK